jgi:hypothetical protein
MPLMSARELLAHSHNHQIQPHISLSGQFDLNILSMSLMPQIRSPNGTVRLKLKPTESSTAKSKQRVM